MNSAFNTANLQQHQQQQQIRHNVVLAHAHTHTHTQPLQQQTIPTTLIQTPLTHVASFTYLSQPQQATMQQQQHHQQQQQQQQHHQQFTAALAAVSQPTNVTMFDTTNHQQYQTITNELDKTFYADATTIDATPTAHVFTTTTTTTNGNNITTEMPANTILITNNFLDQQQLAATMQQQQQHEQQQQLNHIDASALTSTTNTAITNSTNFNLNNNANNIRIVATTATTQPALQQQQQIFETNNIHNSNNNNNNNNNKETHHFPNVVDTLQQLRHQQIIPQQLFQLQQQQQHLPITQQQSKNITKLFTQTNANATTSTATPINHQNYASPQRFSIQTTTTGASAASASTTPPNNHHQIATVQQLTQSPQYYIPTETQNGKIMVTSAVSSVSNSLATQQTSAITETALVPAVTSMPLTQKSTNVTANGSSTVVLDRINISINNHFADASLLGLAVNPAIITATSTATTTNNNNKNIASQSSPIIPAIKHKQPIFDTTNNCDDADVDAVTIGNHNNDNAAVATAIVSGNIGTPPTPTSITTTTTAAMTTTIIDEPDSTTTTTIPQTPPTTPENSSPINTTPVKRYTSMDTTTKDTPIKNSYNLVASSTNYCNMINSERESNLPTTVETVVQNVPTTTNIEHVQNMEIDDNDDDNDDGIEIIENNEIKQIIDDKSINEIMYQTTLLTPPTPTTPTPTPMPTPQSALIATTTTKSSAIATATDSATSSTITAPVVTYNINEDVFIKRLDGRFYLGTIIKKIKDEHLVRFDDKSEIWCTANDLKKLGISNDKKMEPGPMCVACKQIQNNNIVEICERCGRGYHQSCTLETVKGSGVWLCKRCVKPMKVLYSKTKQMNICRQLPYNMETLTWDDKHRVNEEQVYCYCGKSGKFDQNMLQCCKCKNWFHTICMQNFKTKILRGDGFFVFCCTICNNGVEFLKRLQMNWIDMLHLTLYNLSTMKKSQHQKYHHLLDHIMPFLLNKRNTLPIAKEWKRMSENDFKNEIKKTLNENPERFKSGREIKQNHYFYALRNNGPPILPKINVNMTDVLNETFLTNNLKLNVYKYLTEYNELSTAKCAIKLNKLDIYEFHIDDDDEEKFTSDDEIPIKQILEKAKNKTTTPKKSKKMNEFSDSAVANDENTNQNYQFGHIKKNVVQKQRDTSITNYSTMTVATTTTQPIIPIAPPTTTTTISGVTAATSTKNQSDTSFECQKNVTIEPSAANNEKSSRRKRKFNVLSNNYKEFTIATTKSYKNSRICDLSSDENSSSSRCTSLDLGAIIPPPINFLGKNNPFVIVSPKKKNNAGDGCVSSSAVRDNDNKIKNAAAANSNAAKAGSGKMVKKSFVNTNGLDFSSKLAALKSTGIFSNLTTSNLARAAGQSRTVRTIKRRLSAKDILIGPNQEVRRRRLRRKTGHFEVISTTTINGIPKNFVPIYAKDPNQTATSAVGTATTSARQQLRQQQISSASSSPPTSSMSSNTDTQITVINQQQKQQQQQNIARSMNGRTLRERSQRISQNNSRRSSISGASTSSNLSTVSSTTNGNAQPNVTPTTTTSTTTTTTTNADSNSLLQDLKETVNRYFGAKNRIESGAQFSICIRRTLPNGTQQYLLEWGEPTTSNPKSNSSSNNNSSNNSPNKNGQ